ncbi:MAG: glycoside hydrolase family 16 protein [Oscillospiraceae bacterium]|nr:glycoside hydrolase family 16 protein [Oscillospiraceae bacterium]
MNANATMVSNFTTGNAGDFFASDGWTNGKPFDCWWYKQNAQIVNGLLELKIDQKWNPGDANSDWNPQYSGGEFRTNNFYHYGYYETSMKAIKNDGVVSSFFTYTGPSDIVNGQKNPWDEIDIEILGKDTTQVQLNYYRNGQGNHEKMISLGFDASQDFHRYGFNWQPGKITWYIDGKEVWSMSGDVPVTPSKIMMNAWPGKTVDDWLKAYNGNKPLTAYYQWVTYNQQ